MNIQHRLMIGAIIFFFLFCAILSLAPALIFRTWDVTYRWSHWIGFLIWLASMLLMQKGWGKTLPNVDPYLLPLYAILTGWGVLTIWRLNQYFGIRQALWLIVSVLLIIILTNQKRLLFYLRQYKYTWLLIGLMLVLMTFLFGTYPGGSGPQLWLGIRGLYVQPSEFLKILMIIFLAAYFAEIPESKKITYKSVLPTLGIFIFTITFLVLQQDLGTTLIFMVIYTVQLFLIIGRKRVIGIGALVFAISAVVGYLLVPLVRIRTQTWLNPWQYSSTSAYQSIQATIAMAAGGILGSGVGLGNPNIVPIAHSDFIFSSIAEECGLVGALGLLLIFAMFMLRGFIITRQASTRFQRFLAAGLTVLITFQSVLIIGGNIRLFPITGVTLPFVSYGGSSLLSSSALVAILALISASEEEPKRESDYKQSIEIVGKLFLFIFLLLGLASGWWSFWRANDLQTRTDNPRLALTDVYVPRGAILSGDDEAIVSSQGEIGSLRRIIHYPPLSTVTGYNHTRYGKSGLEKSYNDYLRGYRGYPASTVWLTHLVYDQAPVGLDIRLTINMSLQRSADELLGDKKGAVVLIRADNGEILAIASHPSFDANTLDQNWQAWTNSQEGEFLNRPSQGAYPIGNTAVPFLLLGGQEIEESAQEKSIHLYIDGKGYQCTEINNDNPLTNDLRKGCANALLALIGDMNPDEFITLLNRLQLLDTIDIGLPTNERTISSNDFTTALQLLFGKNPLRISPLQLVRVAASISNGGIAPNLQLVSAVNTSTQGWVLFSATDAPRIASAAATDAVQKAFASGDINGWEFSGVAFDKENDFSWYIAGTPPEWQGAPLAIVVLIEEPNPSFTKYVGQNILMKAYSE